MLKPITFFYCTDKKQKIVKNEPKSQNFYIYTKKKLKKGKIENGFLISFITISNKKS